ncbi:MAG TPA: helix-turn-helix domain-containing protein [archaeon]|nr:helix-turn-helix domain-containing protein [archaeon]
MIEKALAKIGFSPSEISVYLLLLKKEQSYAGKISSETGINRTNVYEALNRLVAKGVVSYITRNKVKWFEAKDIDSLKTLLKEKEEEFEKNKNELFIGITQLEKTISKEKKNLEASIFVGRKGLKTIFEEMLEIEKPTHFFAAELKLRKFFGAYFEQWNKIRIEKKILHRVIFAKKVKKDAKIFPLMKCKFVDDEYINPTTTLIYGDNVVLVEWSSNPFAIKIESREIAKSHLNYFNLIWNSN